MKKQWVQEITNRLDERARGEIAEIQHSIRRIRRGRGKLRFIFKDSLLAGEWINSTDLVIVTGMQQLSVDMALFNLMSDDEITGQSYTKLEYYESFRNRTDRAAKLLVALASARWGCPEDEVSLATMFLPDVQRTSAEGVVQTRPAIGVYWRRQNDEGPGTDDAPLDTPLLTNI